VFVDKKGEWLFLCGRDLMKGSIEKAHATDGLVLVQNQNDENIGLGRVLVVLSDRSQRKDKIVIKNVKNRGEFLGK